MANVILPTPPDLSPQAVKLRCLELAVSMHYEGVGRSEDGASTTARARAFEAYVQNLDESTGDHSDETANEETANDARIGPLLSRSLDFPLLIARSILVGLEQGCDNLQEARMLLGAVDKIDSILEERGARS